MALQHSLPTMDITPLRDVCFADTGIRMPENFVDVVKDEEQKILWQEVWFARREHKDRPIDGDERVDPSAMTKTAIDERLIVRQKKSALRQVIQYGMVGNVNNPTNPITEMLYDALGDNRKYFDTVQLIKMDGNAGLIPHKDGSGTTRLYIPIYPAAEDYARLEMYHNNQIYYVYNYVTPPPVYIFNTSVLHAVFNQGYPTRLNVQVVTLLPYNEVVDLFNESIS